MLELCESNLEQILGAPHAQRLSAYLGSLEVSTKLVVCLLHQAYVQQRALEVHQQREAWPSLPFARTPASAEGSKFYTHSREAWTSCWAEVSSAGC